MILDFILIFTVIICFFIGYKNGITKMLVSIVIFIFSISLVTHIFTLSEERFFASEYGAGMVEEVSRNINEKLEKFNDKIIDVSPFLGKYIINTESRQATEKAVQNLSRKCVQIIITIPLIIISFIIFRLILLLIKYFVSKATKLPVIGGIDSVLGSVCGLITGVVLVWLMYTSLCYVRFLPSAAFIEKQLGDSLVVMVFSDFLHK